MRAFYSDTYLVPLPPGHRFPMQKYQAIRDRLLTSGLIAATELEEAPLAPREALERVHTQGYLDALFALSLSKDEERRLGFPFTHALLARSRASVGGTLAAARHALVSGVAGNLAGGTHHAFADHGEGYCVFNDLAVTVRTLQAERKIERAAVIDLDVHQGNGTAAIFEGDPNVFTFSMHGEHNFPFRKARSSRDVGLADGTGDAEYLDLLERHLVEVLEASDPHLLIYQAGVDGLAEDALGRLSLTHRGLYARDLLVLRTAWGRGIPVVLTLGGGYARPIEATVEAHLGTYRAAHEVFGDPHDSV
ncbi:MAG TPA: histone deacetylase [Myxococcaceae bacterium]|nr:histone deacetylase [Myxococcaceae bacterium]